MDNSYLLKSHMMTEQRSCWVPLTVKTFTIEGNDEPVPVCHDSTCTIARTQIYQSLANILCHHSKVSANIIQDFDKASSLDGAETKRYKWIDRFCLNYV